MAEAGKKFLASKALEKGVRTLPSGMLYEVLKRGPGTTHPKPSDQCSVHYKGMLITEFPHGKPFDSSLQRGEPSTFAPNQVIAGWTEALQLMKEGDKWRVFIPQNLAYGSRGAGDILFLVPEGEQTDILNEMNIVAV